MTSVMPRARNAIRRETPRYECRVVRPLQPGQSELTAALGLLAANTSNYVEYNKIGKTGVTIIMLEPILRQILLKDRRGVIPRDHVQNFESELRERLGHAQYADYDIPIDPLNPLALYGGGRWLGLQFDPRDYRLTGDRAVVEEYVTDNYDRPDGRPLSRRFIDANTRRLKPHATIGEVHYENMTPAQEVAFRDNPTTFLVREAYARMERNVQDYGPSYAVTPIVWPETVALAGLSVHCERKQ